MLNSIFESGTTSIEVTSLLISSIVSLILGFVIAMTHKYTSRYSKNFLITITLLPILVEAVMVMVNGNLGTSVAIMGAFGLVRFRSIPGTSKEILIVFFAMAVGLATGMGQVWFAMLLTVLGCIMILLLNGLSLFNRNNYEKKLTIMIPENLDYTEIFDEVFEEYTKQASLEKTKTTNMGSMFELTYDIVLKSNVKEKDFIDQLRVRNGNLKILLSRETNQLDL